MENSSRRLPAHFELGLAIAAGVLLLALGLIHVLYLSTAVYLISVALLIYLMWRGRETNTVYTVILGCASIAILTALYCLWLELGRYHLDVKARQSKTPVAAARLVGPRLPA